MAYFKSIIWDFSAPDVSSRSTRIYHSFLGSSFQRPLVTDKISNWFTSFNKLSSLKASLQERHQLLASLDKCKLVLVGNAGVGKTALATQLLQRGLSTAVEKRIKKEYRSSVQVPALKTFASIDVHTKGKLLYDAYTASSDYLILIDDLEGYLNSSCINDLLDCSTNSQSNGFLKPQFTVVNIEPKRILEKFEQQIQKIDQWLKELWDGVCINECFSYHCNIDLRAKIRKVVRFLFKNMDDTHSVLFTPNLALLM